jgi:hypothetical protein
MWLVNKKMRFFPLFFVTAGILVIGMFVGNDAYTPNKPSSSRRRFAPFIRKEDMTGVWKLTHPKLSLPTTSKQKDEKDVPPTNDTVSKDDKEEEIVLRLNDDGTFDPYTTKANDEEQSITTSDTSPEASPAELYSLRGVLSRGGVWEFRDSNLILAPDRPESADKLGAKVHDTLLAGPLKVQISESLPSDQKPIVEPSSDKVDDSSSVTSKSDNTENVEIDVHLSIPSGHVSMGKFMYPRRHKAFFDDPMLFPDSPIGSFAMKQILGNLNARLKRQEEDEANKKPPRFSRSNFYDRRFYLTATPHAVNPSLAAQDKHYDADKVKYDVRVMPVTFHSNNTFTAIGTDRILRGRFGISGEEGERLWFQVNLFGFGRSAPGSIYSEGRLLSHDDRRGYLGEIQEYQGGPNNQTMYFVDGEFYYGTDLKRANKAHSWGTFSLQEISLDDGGEEDEEDEEGDEIDDDISDSFPTFDSDMGDSPLRDDGDDTFQ